MTRKMFRVDMDAMDKITSEEWTKYYTILLKQKIKQCDLMVEQGIIPDEDYTDFVRLLYALEDFLDDVQKYGWRNTPLEIDMESNDFIKLEMITYLLDGIIFCNKLKEPHIQLAKEDKAYVDSIVKRWMIEEIPE